MNHLKNKSVVNWKIEMEHASMILNQCENNPT